MDSSSSSSTRQPSPSPSPRTMRRGGRPSSHSHSRTTSQDSNSFFHPSTNVNHDHPQDRSTSLMYGTHSGRHPSLSLPIPHSNEDLDRIRLEQQLGSLSMMSSSHVSSSAAARSVDDDDGSSVEMGRGYDGRNLSGQGGRDGSTLAGGSYSTVGGASPVSTAGHHVSAVTLRAGLVGGAGGRHGGGGAGEAFDEDRELGRMLNAAGGAGGGISFGLGDMGLGDTPVASSKQLSTNRRVTESDFRGANKGRSSPGRPAHSVNNENQPPSSHRQHHHLPSPLRPKLSDGLTHSFSPKRPSSIASPPPNSSQQQRGSARPHQESRFETLARGLEDQIRVGGGGSRLAMGEVSLNGVGGEGRRHPSGGRRKGGRGGGGGANSSMMSSTGLQRDSQGKMRLFLPEDVTGITHANETPGRPGRKDLGDGGNEDDPNLHPLPSLGTLSTRLTVLESQNSHSRKRIVELELELQTAGEREQAAKEEWRLEREYLKAEQRERERERERTSSGRIQEGEWEKRYWEVVEEKKALEALVQTLRAQLARLTSDLTSQRNLITQLQNQRSLDAAEISRRGEEVERLRQEVAKLAKEVGGLRKAVEGRAGGRREVQTSPLLPQERRERDGLGFDLSRVEEQDEQTERVQRREGGGVTAKELVRLQADVERRQPARTSPVERPASRLSDGLRAAASLNQFNLPNPDRSPPLGHARPISSSSTARPADSHHHTNARPSSSSQFKPTSNERDQLDQLFPSPPSPYDSGPASPPAPNGWARSFVREEEIIDVDEQDRTARPRAGPVDEGYGGEEESLINFDDDVPAVGTSSSTKKASAAAPKASSSWSKGKKPEAEKRSERLPPQTVLARVLRELEDDFGHYKAIYIELADQYKLMDSASNVAKRNVLAEHLKEVIDTLEQKGDQIASLYSLLTFADRPLPPDTMSTSEKKAFKSVKDLLRSVNTASAGKEKPRWREGVV